MTKPSHNYHTGGGGGVGGGGGGVYPEKMRGIRIGVGGPLPDTRPPPQTHTHIASHMNMDVHCITTI